MLFYCSSLPIIFFVIRCFAFVQQTVIERQLTYTCFVLLYTVTISGTQVPNYVTVTSSWGCIFSVTSYSCVLVVTCRTTLPMLFLKFGNVRSGCFCACLLFLKLFYCFRGLLISVGHISRPMLPQQLAENVFMFQYVYIMFIRYVFVCLSLSVANRLSCVEVLTVRSQ